jgi:hypothetical protein
MIPCEFQLRENVKELQDVITDTYNLYTAESVKA